MELLNYLNCTALYQAHQRAQGFNNGMPLWRTLLRRWDYFDFVFAKHHFKATSDIDVFKELVNQAKLRVLRAELALHKANEAVCRAEEVMHDTRRF